MITQATAVFFIAIIFSVAGAGLTAYVATEETSKSLRSIRFAVVVGVLITLAVAIAMIGLRLNFTPSMPLGIYRIVDLSPRAVQRGMTVAVCAPATAISLGRHRGYLSAGTCFGNSEPLLKTVAAVAGDSVTIASNGVSVNGCLLRNSKPLAADSSGNTMTPWPSGRYRMSTGSIWLYAGNKRSWDSRYWGPVSVRNVVGEVSPVLVARVLSSIY